MGSKVGRILVNTGDGKGKTTAALGTAFRAAGHGQNVAIVQFLKGKWTYGELAAIQRFPNIFLARMGSGFTWEKEGLEEDRALANAAWEMCRRIAQEDDHDLLVMDELNYAIDYGFIEVDDVVRFLKEKPERLAIIITGRRAREEIMDCADTVTEMRVVKHAFKEGTRAQKGIEY
ncbi:MAG: cob(I)yrinic acid a,c-diamide adenosyltransferase [Actinobacteria bacterium]|nr:cob(I)yrinic acid a,c-diamide adenosyltransferase [Actinomycetota bacterium]